MHNSVIVCLINDDVRLIEGQYEEGSKRHIFKTMDPTITVDDMLVVESSTRWGMTTIKVTEVDVDINYDTERDLKWVVQKIDKPSFDQLLEKEKAAIEAVQAAEKRRKKAELRANLIKDHEEAIQTLTIANYSGDEAVTE